MQLTSRNLPYSHLKPGQKQLERDYYAKATLEKPDGNVTLKNYSRFDSDYNDKISHAVKPSDYNPNNKGQNSMSKEIYNMYSQLRLFPLTRTF